MWGRRLGLVLAFGLTLGVAVAAGAFAAEDTRGTCLRSSRAGPGCAGLPPLQVRIDAAVRPRALPKRERRPVALELSGEVATSDGTHPSALREMVIELDRDIALHARGLPVCQSGGRDIRRTLSQIAKSCHDSIVGRGRADFEIEFPEQRPIRIPSKVVVFDYTPKGKPVTLFVDAEIDVPRPTIVAMPIEVSRAHSGDFGLSAVMKVPVIAGGSGSLLDFRFRLKRLFGHGRQRKSLVTARCADGVFRLGFPKILFRNEAHTPGAASTTVMKGGLAVPCSPLD